jgi:murein DD-endopeptidase MepM/ murein hydrolase activator NlpD
MKTTVLMIILMAFSVALGFPFDWPMEGPRIISTFGENHGGNFNTAITLLGEGGRVRAADAGEVVFSAVADEYGLPSGIGNFAVVEHAGGLKTVYGHLKEESIRTLPGNIEAKQTLGRVGDSGWTYGNQLRFTVLDTDFKQIVNPLLLLPSIADTFGPVLERLELLSEGKRIPVEDDITVPSGRYTVTVTAYDRSEYSRVWSPMSVYSITMFVNGLQAFAVKLEALKETEDTLVLTNSGGLTCGDLYRGMDRLALTEIDLLEGRSSIELIARDYAGNETALIKSFIVRDVE